MAIASSPAISPASPSPMIFAAGGDAVLDAIRLGLGGRPPQCASSRPLFRHPRRLRPVPPLRPGGGLGAHGRGARHHAFLPPTALKMMRARERPRERYDLRSAPSAPPASASGARPMTGRRSPWARRQRVLRPDRCNYVLGSSAALGVTRAGAIGKPIPGHTSRSSAMTARGRSPASRARSRSAGPTRRCSSAISNSRRRRRRNSSATG